MTHLERSGQHERAKTILQAALGTMEAFVTLQDQVNSKTFPSDGFSDDGQFKMWWERNGQAFEWQVLHANDPS